MPKIMHIPTKGPVLKWARLLQGLTVPDAAQLLGIHASTLQRVESEAEPLSPTLFRKMMAVYKQTESSLLRARSPSLPTIPEDFRTAGNRPASLSPETRQAIREARRVQRYVSRLVAEDPELITHLSLPVATTQQDPEVVAKAERVEFSVPLPTQKTKWRVGQETFRKWRARLQERGIVVMLKEMPWKDCRGLSLWESDSLVPVIIVNSEDALNAAVFTMFHEYAHLLLRRSGICAESGGSSATGKIEIWCNRFAAAFLIPEADVRELISKEYSKLGKNDWTLWHITRIAGRYRVSREVMARRLQELQISNYYRLHGGELAKFNQKKKGKAKPGTKVVLPRSEVARVKEIGYSAASVVLDALRGGLIDVGEAADILELRVERLRGVEEQVEEQRVRDVAV